MALSNKLENKIKYRIIRSKKNAFILSDFYDLSDTDQILRALRKLMEKKIITKIGQGIYAKIKKSLFSDKFVLNEDLKSIALQAFKKLRIETVPTKFEKLYTEGKITQMPLGNIIGVTKRVNRKIQFNGKAISYELIR